MAIEKTVELKIDAKEALKRLEAVEKELADINKTAKKTEQATSTLATGFRGIGLAWKAIGIGAVISALQFLADKFSANQEILDKVNIASAVFGDILNKIGTVVVSVVQGLGLLGQAVGKVLKGEFKEAGEIAKQSFDGVKEAVVGNNESFGDFIKNVKNSATESKKFGQQLIDLRNEVKLSEAEQRGLQATYERDAELQRQIRDDISLTIDERIAANDELARILDEQFAQEEALAQKKVELAELELSRNKDNIDLQVALQNARNELLELDNRITSQKSENLVNEKALEKEKQDAIQETIDLEKKRLDETKKNAKKTVDISKKTGETEVKIAKLTNEQKVNIVAGSLGAVSDLIGKESAAGKALAVAQATISTYSAAAAALAPPPVGAGPILGPIAAGIAVATGLKSVSDIMKTKLPGGDVGGGSLPSIEAPPVAESPIDNEIEELGPTGLGPLIPNIEAVTTATQPIQAYVVENDISSSQALQEELEVQATL